MLKRPLSALLICAAILGAPHANALIISKDTVWDDTSKPYTLGLIQVAATAKLTIMRGVTVNGGTIEVFGQLDVRGRSGSLVYMNDVQVGSKPGGQIKITYANFTGDLSIDGNTNNNPVSSSSLSLTNSVIRLSSIYLFYPDSSVLIENNIIEADIRGLTDIVYGWGPICEELTKTEDFVAPCGNIYIRNNYFLGGRIYNIANYDGSKIIVERNSFSPGALSLEVGSSGSGILANDNWWGTSDRATIGQMIEDRSDDLNRGGYTVYDRILYGPHPGTPNPNQTSYDIDSITDLSSDALADIAVLPLTGTPKTWLYSSADASALGTISFFNDRWIPIAVDVIDDGNSDGVENDSLIAALGLDVYSGTVAVQVRAAGSNAPQIGENINFFSSGYRPIDVAVVNDTNGDGVTNDPSVAVLAQRYSSGRQAVQVRSLDGALLGNWTITKANQQILAIAGVSIADGQSRISVLVRDTQDGNSKIRSIRIADGARLRNQQIAYYSLEPVNLSVRLDGNGDGQAGDPAYLILAKNAAAREQIVRIMDVRTGNRLGDRSLLNDSFEPHSIAVSPDLSGDNKEDVLTIASRKAYEQLLIKAVEIDSTKAVSWNVIPPPR